MKNTLIRVKKSGSSLSCPVYQVECLGKFIKPLWVSHLSNEDNYPYSGERMRFGGKIGLDQT